MLQGKVLRAQNSFFYVETPQGIVEAKLRGRLKKARIAVVPGDEVELELLEDGTGIIEHRSATSDGGEHRSGRPRFCSA